MTKRTPTNIFISKESFKEGFPVTLFEIISCTNPRDAEKVANWFAFKPYFLQASHYSKDDKCYLAVASDELLPTILHCDEYHYKLELKYNEY